MLRTAYANVFGCAVNKVKAPFRRTVKLGLLILVSIHLQSFLGGESQVVSLTFKEAPLQKVFAEIRKQTGYSFAYFETDLAKAKPVSINITNTRVQDALNTIFQHQPLTYTIIEKVVVVKQKDPEKKIGLPQSPQQPLPPMEIYGRVLNERDDPVAGVTVQVKGTRIGTATDGEGEFRLKNVEPDATLVLTGVNIEPVEKQVNGQRILNLQVKGRSGKLDEVQVIAYGKTSQRFNTGNVTTVKAEDIEKQPVSNPLLALQGRVPGLLVTQETGMNGGGVKIRIQGENSIANGNNPLIVVDGIPYPSELPAVDFSAALLGNEGKGSPLSFINVNDIESIDILKDADATSIYGSRAANGAILITTKKGRSGKMRVNINLQQGWSRVASKVDMLNSQQYLEMRREGLKNVGLIPADKTGLAAPYSFAPDLLLWDTTRFTDWQEELIGNNAQYSNFNASLSGGSPTSNYLVGFTWNRNTDVFPGEQEQKGGTIHANLNASSVDQRFKLQLTNTYSINDNALPGVDLTRAALTLVPVAPPLFSKDTLNWEQDANGLETWDNPLVNTYYVKYRSNTRTLYSNAMLSYNFMPGFMVRTMIGYTNIQAKSSRGIPLAAIRPSARATTNRLANFNTSHVYNFIIEPQLSYQRRFGHARIDWLLGATLQEDNTESLNITAMGYTSDLLMNSISTAPTISSGHFKTIYKYNALFSRLSVNWADRYLLNLNARRDGSSRFGDKRRFENFGSIGLGWIFSEERMMKRNLPWLSFGKLRFSYGTTGNDQIGDYSFLSANILIGAQGVLYQGVAGMMVNKLYNPYLQWEATNKMQGGVDIGLLNDRIFLGLTYARNRCSNQLIAYALPDLTGFSSIGVNLPATLQNTSWELILNSVLVKTTSFKWSASANLTIPRNEVTSFPNIEETSYANPRLGIVVGQPRGSVYVGNFQGVDPAVGRYAVSSLSKFIATAPVYYGGIQQSLTCKGFQLDFLVQFVRQWGNKAFEFWNGQLVPGSFIRGEGNQPVTVLERWQKPGDQALVGFFTANAFGAIGNLPNSDGYYSLDASYMRLKNAALSWQAPAKLTSKLGLQSGRIYTQGQNLFTITRFSGLDPENQSGTSLPPLQTFTFGIQVTF